MPDDLLHQNVAKFFQHNGSFDWNQVPCIDYKETDPSWNGVSRRVFVGETGESADFHVRYFELQPLGFTTLEEHDHEHVVVVLRGVGSALLGVERIPLAFGDVVYVSPRDPHQFRNEHAEQPFGFLCMVNAQRDRPRLTTAEPRPVCR
jgi:quercetin dioxygenase-like cupin family protein